MTGEGGCTTPDADDHVDPTMRSAPDDRQERRGQAGLQPLRSKLRPARSHVPLVCRDALVASLARTSASLILVSAPAGAGKSTLLAQFAEADGRPVAWLQLDEGDNDPVVFLTYLAAALEAVAPVDPELSSLLQQRRPPIDEQILPRLEEALRRAPPCLCILDDTHLLDNTACWRIIGRLTRLVPDRTQLILSTRTDPPLPLARLHAAGRVTEYRMMDLAVTRAEAARLLELHGERPDDTLLDVLMERTEGWITGLCLALLAHDRRPSEDWSPSLRGDQHAIAAYLLEEVLERQPPPVQRFLLRTSIAEQLSPALAQALTSDEQAADLLARLARENAFVSALDDHDEWFRYHHLFGQLLRSQLARREPDTVAGLHAAAADWFHGRHDHEAEARHRLQAGQLDKAAWPAARAADDHLLHGRIESAVRLLGAFTDQQLRADPLLTLAAFEVYASAGDPRQHRWAAAALAVELPDGPSPVDTASLQSWQLLLRIVLAPEGVGRMLVDARRALRLEAAANTQWVSYASACLGWAEFLNGKTREAERLFHTVLDLCGDDDERALTLASLSLLAGEQGRWNEAGHLMDEALQLEPPTEVLSLLPVVLARLRVSLHRADAELDSRVAQAEAMNEFVMDTMWKRILRAVVLGEVALARDLIDAAERWVASAESDLGAYPDAGVLGGRVRRLRHAIEERRLTEPLTTAERRVLDLLPTQLTAELMARRLFVSQNTVKSHQRHLYAKLGVTTRTAAVDRARELSLLPPASS